MILKILAAAAAMIATPIATADKSAAEPPNLRYAFSARVELLAPIEAGTVDGKRTRFVPISGGRVYGPRLEGEVLPGGGDWQTIDPNGLTEVNARYMLKATDGTVIDVVNAGVRTASEAVTRAIARGETVAADAYYFRTAPRFSVAAGKHEWLRRTMFLARGTRLPDHVVIDFYEVE